MPTSLTRLFLCVITTACFLAVPHQGFAQTQTTSSENNSQNQVNDNKKKQLKVQFTRQPSNAHDPLGDYVPCLFSQDVEDAMRTITRNAPPKPEEIPLPIEIFKNIQQTIFHLRDQYDPVKSPAEYNSLGDFYSALLAIFPPDRLVGQYPAEAYSSLLTAVSGARPKVLAVNSFSSYVDVYRKQLNSQKLTKEILKEASDAAPDKVTAILNQVLGKVSEAITAAVTNTLTPPPSKRFEPPDDISCSIAIMSWQETSDIFGRRVANQFIAIQVTIRNLNNKNEFLVHDIQVAVDTGLPPDLFDASPISDAQYFGRFQAGRDKLLVRSVAQRGQSDDRRNLVLNSLMTIGAIAGSSSIAGSADFKTGVAVFQGAFIPGFSTIFPDHTVEQLNHINDLVFSASNTSKVLVPVQGSVPLVTFVASKPIQQMPFAWCGYRHAVAKPSLKPYKWFFRNYYQQACQENSPEYPTPYRIGRGSLDQDSQRPSDGSLDVKDQLPWDDLSYKKWKPAALRMLQQHTFVVIGGVHIQELTNQPPKAGNLDCTTLKSGPVDISQLQDGAVTCNMSGSSLDKVGSVILEKGTEKITGKIKAAKDGNSATLQFDPADLAEHEGAFSLFFVENTSSGNTKEVDSGESMLLGKQPVVSKISIADATSDPLQIAIEGTHLDSINEVRLAPDESSGSAVKIDLPASGGTATKLMVSVSKCPASGKNTNPCVVPGKTYHLQYGITLQVGDPRNAKTQTITVPDAK